MRLPYGGSFAIKVILLNCAVLLEFGETVPPSPSYRMWEDLSNIKHSLHTVSGEVERFNSLYMKQMEPRLLSAAIILGNIDANLKNLQERAHVWDTFQLHVSAWNEQLSTLDRKVDIISKGQEKLLQLEGKYASAESMEYKLEEILKKIESNQDTLSSIDKRTDNKRIEHDSLLSEFTTRGMLSTLKIIERKLDKLQTISHTMLNKQNSLIKKTGSGPNKNANTDNKLVIKCNTPPKVEEILNDVSSKVDVIFDRFEKIAEQNYDKRDIIDQGFLENQLESSGDSSIELKSSGTDEYQLFKNILKRINQPCKKANRILETMENNMKTIENNTFQILEKNSNENNCNSDQRPVLNVTNIEALNRSNAEIVEYLKKLEELFRKVLQGDQTKCYNFNYTQDSSEKPLEIPIISEPKKSIQPKNIEPSIAANKENYVDETSCDNLENNRNAGVYLLGPDRQLNTKGRDFTNRYCENGWTVIQRRGEQTQDAVNFNVSWYEYKSGFGSLSGDFWFGNDYIHQMCRGGNRCVLRIELWRFETEDKAKDGDGIDAATWAWAQFEGFWLGDEDEGYEIRIGGGYSGNASDSLSSHSGSKFSTFDRTNDVAPECCPCAPSYGGGWWFNSCFESNLNGIYYFHPNTENYFKGIIWEHWLGNYSLRKSKMMIKPIHSYQWSSIEIYNRKENATDANVLFIPEDP